MNRTLIAVAALLGLLTWSPAAFAMQCGVQGLTESSHTVFQHSCYEFFFNNSGGTISSGNVVLLQRAGTGENITSGEENGSMGTRRSVVDVNASDGDVTNVGTYITITATDDSLDTIGVADDDTCADQSYCRVQVRGPRLVVCNDLTEAISSGDAVGSSNLTAGTCEAGAGLGIALEAGDGNDRDAMWVWIEIEPGG